jgi:hypothetical protein
MRWYSFVFSGCLGSELHYQAIFSQQLAGIQTISAHMGTCVEADIDTDMGARSAPFVEAAILSNRRDCMGRRHTFITMGHGFRSARVSVLAGGNLCTARH